MYNRRAKFLLVSTSLSPILGAIAVNRFSNDKLWINWVPWLIAAILLVFLCWFLLQYAERNLQTFPFTVKEFENTDKEMLAFLLAYFLPFISTSNMAFIDEWLTGLYIFAIILLVITHAEAFHFNPVMGLFGYHFYAVKDTEGVSSLLISKDKLRRPGTEIEVVQLAYNINLHVGGRHA
ncbi:hypothetical protein FTO68_02385 [Methanocalculus taiwanensis]|uniref:Uncharacterized protein n=1 Tax=Methanocalculus taiwanensis TaxID=106207 RepID=A0ABD4TH59_9EURY|nr:hypothetical protein [Methanocalculus taiwanensis]MCQ1537836.1 hypothetical protein [Methanocalculus taiwanensis]